MKEWNAEEKGFGGGILFPMGHEVQMFNLNGCPGHEFHSAWMVAVVCREEAHLISSFKLQ